MFDTATQSPENRKGLHHINEVVSNAPAIGGPVITSIRTLELMIVIVSDQCAPTRPPKAAKIVQIISGTRRHRARSPTTA